MKQMKRLSRIIVILGLCLTGTMAQAGLITLTSSQQEVLVGDVFSVDVRLNDPFDGAFSGDVLSGFGFDLMFDSNKLFLAGKNISANWDDDSDFFADTDIAGSNFPGIEDTGQTDLLLGTLYFEVLSAGQLMLQIASDSQASFNQGLFYLSEVVDFDASVTLQANEVPAPASMGLLILVLGIYRARSSRLD
ncbi:hypothetical protein [Hahella ganghwensis]|uniref:hypothetical protein n=1 Tax=Hahella ganghwensis TaxID=286420 RepID=UPI00036E4CAC|nr:hypothetical protein [Hahella ganghwensis]